MLKIFLDSYKKCLPQSYSKLLTVLSIHPNLIIHHPITAVPHSSSAPSHPLTTKILTTSPTPIPKGVNIFMLSTSQSFSNVELVGASVQDKMKVNDFFQDYAAEYEILQNQDVRGLFKVLIQVYANQMELGTDMPLHYYARLLMDEAHHDPQQPANSLTKGLGLEFDLKKYMKQIKSFHLLNIIKSNENIVKKMYEILCKNFIKTTNEEQFGNLLKIVRSQLKQIHENAKISNLVSEMPNKKVDVLSPLLPSLRESPEPNCALVGKYFTHLRQSFYCLETLRVIKGGEELTIPRRRGVNNYDKLIRYGYRSLIENPENPDNEYLLIINLMDPSIPEVQQILTTGDIDSKKQCLSLNNLKMKSFLKLSKNGEINRQDLKMLRILYGIIDGDELEKERISVDGKIYGFVGKFVEASLKAHKEENAKVKGEPGKDLDQEVIKAFRVIEAGEIEILENFMKLKNSFSS